MHCAYCGFTEPDHSEAMNYFGISYDDAKKLWRLSLEDYLGEGGAVAEVEKKAELVSTMRVLDHAVRKFGRDSEKGRSRIALFAPRLEELIRDIGELTF